MTRVTDTMFLTVRDGTVRAAEGIITRLSVQALAARYKTIDQTFLYFASARRAGQDDQAKRFCAMLVERGKIDVNHVDALGQTALFYAARQGHSHTIRYLCSNGADPNVKDENGETAIFFAVRQKRVAAVKALLDCGARLEVVSHCHQTCMSVAPDEVLPLLQEARKKRRSYCEESGSGPGPKRRRTAAEELRAWADKWPMAEPLLRKEINVQAKDVVAVKSTDKRSGKSEEYAVLGRCPKICAAALRMAEKEFVLDHALMMEKEPWFGNLKPEDWCQHVAVLTDAHDPVGGIKDVVAGAIAGHFTLPLVQKGTGLIAGYVHASKQINPGEQQELCINHLKVCEEHKGQGLGGLLLDAAEKHSHSIGWECQQTSLCVLQANERATTCYKKAGFRVASSCAASWGQHVWSQWQNLRKVHKYALKK